MRFVHPSRLATVGDGVLVRASTIPGAGNGLFAMRVFERGEVITLYDGEIVTRAEAWSRPVLTHMAAREGVVVDGLKTPEIGRGGGSFANSASSSTEANAVICANLGSLILRAKRRISASDEIFVYYGRRGFAISAPNFSSGGENA